MFRTTPPYFRPLASFLLAGNWLSQYPPLSNAQEFRHHALPSHTHSPARALTRLRMARKCLSVCILSAHREDESGWIRAQVALNTPSTLELPTSRPVPSGRPLQNESRRQASGCVPQQSAASAVHQALACSAVLCNSH